MKKKAGVSPRDVLEDFSDVIALLMWQPRTALELVILGGQSQNQIRRKLAALHDAGLLRVAGQRPSVLGRRPVVYALRIKPFEGDDTPEVDVPCKT